MVWVRRGWGPVARPEPDEARRGRANFQQEIMRDENKIDMETFLSNDVFMRIRVQNNEKVILTAKKPKNIAGEGNLVKREHEVVVDSAEEARNILEMLGLKEAVRTIKKRQTATCGEYEICIDEVEGLGSFIEVEKIAEENEADKILDEMMEFLAPLGITQEDKVTKGYDILILEKQGN
jgi:adenylate cyclase class 2